MDDLLATCRQIAAEVRAVALPIRTTSVEVVTRTWSGSAVGEGTPSEAVLSLGPLKTRELTQKEVASSGGLFFFGDVLVGPITPAYPGGGFTPDQIAPRATADNVEIFYRLTGDVSGQYARLDVSTARPFRYMLTLRNTRDTP